MKRIDLRKPLIFILIVLIGISVVFVAKNLGSGRRVSLKEGRQYIKAQEELAVDDLEDSIKSKKTEEKGSLDLENADDIFAKFDDYVFYGDSRTLHFVSYGFLPANRVFAENGYAFQDVKDWDARLRGLKPSVIYLCYGSNDINREIFTGNNAVQYKEVVVASVKHIQEICPDAQLYILGMIPPNSLGQSQLNQFKMYRSLNVVYQQVCDEMENCTYIDDEVLGENGEADIFTDDGFHFVKEFYPVWAEYIYTHSNAPVKKSEE